MSIPSSRYLAHLSNSLRDTEGNKVGLYATGAENSPEGAKKEEAKVEPAEEEEDD